MLQRRPLYHYRFRYGGDTATPLMPAPRARVLIANEHNGSAAETFAFMFRLAGLGRIVGQRTFGAGIGSHGFQPRLIDGGRLQIPNRAAFDHRRGEWGIENQGVAPDVAVAIRPEDFRADRDPQLERAVAEALALAKKAPQPPYRRPQYPVYR